MHAKSAWNDEKNELKNAHLRQLDVDLDNLKNHEKKEQRVQNNQFVVNGQ